MAYNRETGKTRCEFRPQSELRRLRPTCYHEPSSELSPIEALAKLSADELMLPVLVQLAVIVAAARVGGVLARRVGQPAVVGEILAGLLLGPSLFGRLLPDLSAAVFHPHLPGVPFEVSEATFPKVLQAFSQTGLVLLMFLVGLSFHVEHLRAKGGAAAAVALAGVVVPFAVGAGLAGLVHPHLETAPAGGPLAFALFLGAALAVTAIPTLGRILAELGIGSTRVGTITVAAAAAADAVVWVLLAAVGSRGEPAGGWWAGPGGMLALTVAFAAVVLFVVRPLLGRYLDHALKANGGQLGVTPLAVLLVALLLCGIATNRIGISAVFGAFLLGGVLAPRPGLREALTARLADVVNALFLPVFFTSVGLRTDLTQLGGMWWVAAAVLLAGVAGKLGGCALAARLSGFGWKEAGAIGALMNTRGLMGLVVANIGADGGLIPPSVFAALVLLAVLTTAMTGPAVLLLRKATELEEPIRAAGWGKPDLAARFEQTKHDQTGQGSTV